jgi:hypothetical protein
VHGKRVGDFSARGRWPLPLPDHHCSFPIKIVHTFSKESRRRLLCPVHGDWPGRLAAICAIAAIAIAAIPASAQLSEHAQLAEHTQPAEHAQLAAMDERDVKAAFLLKVANFVEWPAQNSQGPLVIGVIGGDAIAKILERGSAGKAVNGRPYAVIRLHGGDEVKSCNLVFIGSSERTKQAVILERTKREHILTVGEVEGFARDGGMINLLVEEGKIRMEVNPQAVDRAGLRVSSKVLALSRIVTDGNAGGGQ